MRKHDAPLFFVLHFCTIIAVYDGVLQTFPLHIRSSPAFERIVGG